jgi:putative Mg2+ transporter-C (MgtC) family protein
MSEMELLPAIPIHGMDWELLLRLGLAALIGLGIGLDRELQGNAAGMRTHALICFASAAMTVSIVALYFQIDNNEADPLRVFEATGAFIGIVGAGLIVFSKGELKNVTTAVHLWLAAVIGIACGAGQWPLVAIGVAISVVMLTVLGLVEKRFFPDTEKDTK